MAAVGSCRGCRKGQVTSPCCRWGLLRRSSRLVQQRTDGGEDRISGLPDHLLHLFLSRLDCARAAAHAGLYSRRWRNLWTEVPELIFHNTEPRQVVAALNQITRRSLSLLDITVPHHHELEPALVSSLLRSAARVSPADLKIILRRVVAAPIGGDPNHPVEVEMPCFGSTTSIYISASTFVSLVLPLEGEFQKLESLSLSSCILDTAALIPRCPSLRKLRILGSRLLSSITAHSPSLEELEVAMLIQPGLLESVDIRAPMLKKLLIFTTSGISNEFTFSCLAPKLELLSLHCGHYFSDVGFRIWRMSSFVLEMVPKLGDNDEEAAICSPLQRRLHVDTVSLCIWTNGHYEDAPRSFRQLIMYQLQIANFFILELHVLTREHDYGELVMHLLHLSGTLQSLKLNLYDVGIARCSADCYYCHQPTKYWGSQTLPVTNLEEVEIHGFKGYHQEIEFLKVMFRSAPMVKSVIIEFDYMVSPNDNRYMATLGILVEHPSVKSTIRLHPRWGPV